MESHTYPAPGGKPATDATKIRDLPCSDTSTDATDGGIMPNKVAFVLVCTIFGVFVASVLAQDVQTSEQIEKRAETALSNLQTMRENRHLHGNDAQARDTEVTTNDVLNQFDAIILDDSIAKRPPQQTVDALRQMSLLNHLQIEINALKKVPADPKSFAGAFPPDVYDQTFYDLRGIVCKHYRGMVVTLGGKLQTCN
jgi:hypothetical protein